VVKELVKVNTQICNFGFITFVYINLEQQTLDS